MTSSPGNAGSPAFFPPRDERGFSFMEAIMGAIISIIVVLGLAYSFGSGRGMVDRYAEARQGLSAAQARIESLTLLDLSSPQLAVGFRSPEMPFAFRGSQVGSEDWRVTPILVTSGGSSVSLRQVTVTVRWADGVRSDSLTLVRLFPL